MAVPGKGGYEPANGARVTAPDKGIYDPSAGIRGGGERDDEASSGLHPDRHPAPTLRVFTEKQGRLWLLYGGVTGGDQDDQGDTWFELYYRGIVRFEGVRTFGDWILRVQGERLEPLCQQIARQVRTLLRVGSSNSVDNPFKVTGISVSPYSPAVQEDMPEIG